ncbi:MAG: deoxyribose-phosphate aldolase [Terriglobales bacterium]
MAELSPRDYDALVEAILAAAEPRARPVSRVASALESTLLAPDATASQIEQVCEEAVTLGLAAVCVAPAWIALAAERLRSTPVLAVTVVGFPLGSTLGSAKIYEAAECLKLGADELDVVINLAALKSGHDGRVQGELQTITAQAHAAGARVKAILEMGLLSAGELERAADASLAAGADFLKNATGFGPNGASPEAIARLRDLAGGRARIKAAGGIRTAAQAEALLHAGADRLGSSHAASVLGVPTH